MYKIKLFRNMSGLSAGQSMKQIITNRDWWKGVFGNMFSTMLGIALTIGVGALVEYHNDKKLAREMMYQVIMTAENDGKTIHSYDSILHVHKMAILYFLNAYQTNGRDVHKVPVDSLQSFVDKIFSIEVEEEDHTNVDSYFFSSQMMHQFGNPNRYSKFAAFVKHDQETMAKLKTVYDAWEELGFTFHKIGWDDSNPLTAADVLQEMIRNHNITNYYNMIEKFDLGREAAWFKHQKKALLRVAHASEEDYEDYKESIDIDEDTKGDNFHYKGGNKEVQETDD